MTVLVARPTLLHQMAGLTPHTNGKRKVPPHFPTGAQILDLTFDDDDEHAAKRQKSQPAEDNKNGLPSRARDISVSNQYQHQERPPVAAKSALHTLSYDSQQRLKQAQETSAFNPIQYRSAASVDCSGGLGRAAKQSAATPDLTLPSEGEKKVNTNDKLYSINHRNQNTSWHRPAATRPTELSRSEALNASTTKRQRSKPRTDSESEILLQAFHLPQTAAIKFETDASHAIATFPTTNSTPKPVQRPNRPKEQFYDHTDVERVKTIFFSSPRPESSSNSRPTTEPRNGRIRQRQSQRESNAQERLVTENPSTAAKAIILPSRSATPKTEIRRKECTPPRSQISVVIPVSQQKPKQPTVNPEGDQSKKQNLLQDMKRDVAVACQRAESVKRYFGTTGFSTIYGTASDDERLKKIHKLQPNLKKVKRKDVKLDWGDKSSATKPFKHDELVHPRERIKELATATVLSVTSGPPLTFVNNIDDRQLNGKFQFISEYVIREGVRPQPPHLNAHINCSDSCTGVCSPSTCNCLRNDKMQNFIGHPVPSYHHRSDGLIVLNDDFITLSKEESARTEIVECNNNCKCDEGCYNRVVQRGRTLPLEIFMTKTCGFGLRCPRDIVKGQFIDVYLGEVVIEATLIERENAQEEGEPSYLFSLDWFNEKLNYVHYQVDGANFGTPMRFVNHSCNANCRVFPVMLKEYDENIYGLAVFALKDIPAMSELTLDYAPLPDHLEKEEDLEAERARCQCGEDGCRGWLWPKGTKRARRRKAA